jgi:peptidoglycan LD-endopeptidase LytH
MNRRRPITCLVLIAIVGIGLLLVIPHPRALFTLITSPAPTSLPVPVRGVPPKALVDTWGAPRSGGRIHKGIDIFAERGTEIVTPVSGLVLDIGRNRLGGNVVKILGPGAQVHYFAHLDGFGPLEERGLVRVGEVVGYVGDTGNARGTPPHLHYGIYVLSGRAINPYTLLTNFS